MPEPSDQDGNDSPDIHPTIGIDRVATGGNGVGRLVDGRVAFVTGALPGETARISIDRERKRHVEATAIEIVSAAPARQAPPCPHVADGCGGCDWQHVEHLTAQELRRSVVVDCLERIGRLADPPVVTGPVLDPSGYRTIVRAAVVDGRAGFRMARAHDVVTLDSCLVAHPLVEELLTDARYPGASEISIKVGARTGERLVLVDTTERCALPPDVTVVGAGNDGHIHEEIHGRRLRVSARSFFQCRPDGAEALVDLVGQSARSALGTSFDSGGCHIVDAYGGVGLFGATLGAGHRVTSIESSPSSCADAQINLAANGVVEPSVVQSDVEAWASESADLVIADPSRKGLGAAATDVLTQCQAPVFVLVSCDPAALGRDARLLTDAGYELTSVTTVDLFGYTAHVEAVSTFVRR